ncbi:unnamed protein product, partial [Prorocentrum cordatum]
SLVVCSVPWRCEPPRAYPAAVGAGAQRRLRYAEPPPRGPGGTFRQEAQARMTS